MRRFRRVDNSDSCMAGDHDGDWVLYEDAEKELSRLRADNDTLRVLATVRAQRIKELKRELERERARHDVPKTLPPIGGGSTGIRCTLRDPEVYPIEDGCGQGGPTSSCG